VTPSKKSSHVSRLNVPHRESFNSNINPPGFILYCSGSDDCELFSLHKWEEHASPFPGLERVTYLLTMFLLCINCIQFRVVRVYAVIPILSSLILAFVLLPTKG